MPKHPKKVLRTHWIHVWYIYLHLPYNQLHVGKYTIHGSYGNRIQHTTINRHCPGVLGICQRP